MLQDAKVTKSVSDAKQTAAGLGTRRGLATKYGADIVTFCSANFGLRTLGYTIR